MSMMFMHEIGNRFNCLEDTFLGDHFNFLLLREFAERVCFLRPTTMCDIRK